jgi:putative two-component system response regulator
MGPINSDRLDPLLGGANRPLSSEFKNELTRLSARLKERHSRGSAASFDFFTAAVTALSKLRGTMHAELRLTCLLCCGHFFYNSGFAQSALRAARELEVLAFQVRDKLWMRKALNLRGIVNADVGNVSEALIAYTGALSLAREMGDKKAEMLVLNNLGGALVYGGLLREAILCFQKVAAQDKSDLEMRVVAQMGSSNLAQIHLQKEEYSQGIDALARNLAVSDEPFDAETALNRTICEFMYVQLALGLGQIELARKHLKYCLRFSRWGESRRSIFLATVAEGLFEVHASDVMKGISKLENALAGTEEINHARITCLTALVKAFDEAGQPERALHYLHELLNDVRSKREAGISALMEIASDWDYRSPAKDSGILDVLERREFKLRAAVAEREVANSRIEMLERLAVTADLKEEESGEHGYRVGKLAALLAEEMRWSREASVSLEFAARLHDIGKIGVPDRILLNSQALKDAERHFIGTHTVIGAELLAKSNVPQLRIAEDVAHYHHEWWDGTGYPSKLKGKRIPIHARIVALADVFDALTHGRPYSEAWSMDRAMEEIRTRRGSQFDPELTDLFLNLVARLRTEHEDLDAFLAKAALNSPFAQARKKIRSMLAEEHANERQAMALATASVD